MFKIMFLCLLAILCAVRYAHLVKTGESASLTIQSDHNFKDFGKDSLLD